MVTTIKKQSDLLKAPTSVWAGSVSWISNIKRVQTPTYNTFANSSIDYSKQQSVDPTLWKYMSEAPMMSTVEANNKAAPTIQSAPNGLPVKWTTTPTISTTWVGYSPDIEYINKPWDLLPWESWASQLKAWQTISQDMIDSLKAKYWTINDLKSSDTYNNASDSMKQQLESYYWTTPPVTPTWTETTTPVVPWAWTYTDTEWNKVDILWYNDLPADVKTLIDWMTDAEKKQLDMIYGNDLNAKAEYVRQAKRTQEYLTSQRDLTLQIKDLEWNILEIQASQRLRDAQKNVDNLIQNVNYLWQMWMPWVSATKLNAATKMIWDAQKKFTELKTIETNVAQMRALWLEMDTKAYEKQMADISDDLNVKVWKYIQWALNSFTAAELAWELDTIDWVQQFKRSLLEQLDSQISWYTEWSMKQMQYVTESYTKIADDAMTRLTEYNKNANTVNTDLSTARWVYTDGNGNPIYDSTWVTIPMPVKPPLDPIFDKESGKLIMFSTDENWQIVANVKQVTTEATMSQAAIQWYANLINEWTIKLSDVPANMKNAVVQAISQPQWWWYEWPAYTPATQDKLQQAFNQVTSQWDWSIWWQCWAFVNDYLQDAGVWRLFIDPIDKKKAVKNSDIASVWSIAIMDSPTSPQYWHVWIITAINWNQYTIKQSNWWKWLENKVYTSTATDNWDWTFTITWPSGKSYTTNSYGFFDPMKSPETTSTSQQWDISIDDIISFNDDVTRRKMKKDDINRIATAKKAVMSDKNASIEDILAWSNWWKSVWAEQSKSFAKYDQAMSQVDAIAEQISDMKTWPILWTLRSMNPRDTNTQTLKAKLQWLIPTIARWVYWEVWVLTDNDIRLYSKTLPNLKGTDAINKWVLAYTLDILAWWYKKQLTSLAWQWYDVSWLEWTYQNIKWQAEALRTELGIPSSDTWTNTTADNDPLWIR